jgi:hypothetical protein
MSRQLPPLREPLPTAGPRPEILFFDPLCGMTQACIFFCTYFVVNAVCRRSRLQWHGPHNARCKGIPNHVGHPVLFWIALGTLLRCRTGLGPTSPILVSPQVH